MIVDIIVGATNGDEGKSKFSYFYTKNVKYKGIIKIGGYCTNHTMSKDGQQICTHMLPAGTRIEDGENDLPYYIFPECTYIDFEILKSEAELRGIPSDHIIIDPNASIMPDKNILEEYDAIYRVSTVSRDQILIGEVKDVYSFLLESSPDDRFLVEGQGGYGLGKELQINYGLPMVAPTMTASGIASLLNIAPTDIDDVILVTRLENYLVEAISYNEHPWFMIMSGMYEKEGGWICEIYNEDIEPYDFGTVRQAIFANDPSIIVLNCIDEVEPGALLQENSETFTDAQYDVIEWIENTLGITFDYVGYGEMDVARLKNSVDGGIGDELYDIIEKVEEDMAFTTLLNVLDSLEIKEGDTITNETFQKILEMSKKNPKLISPSQIKKMKQKENLSNS